ncbi:hypothetical protein, partial [Rhodococcoides yunnanense]|uniref:hypothetical protein n=1 Tax=Rhodococcoides yunnanense TaxID=278209 RepID=UPI0022B14957
ITPRIQVDTAQHHSEQASQLIGAFRLSTAGTTKWNILFGGMADPVCRQSQRLQQRVRALSHVSETEELDEFDPS